MYVIISRLQQYS